MGKSNVNAGFAKCFIFFMAIVILVQGCLYFALAIWGITQESCSGDEMNVQENPFRFVLDLIYFIKEECGGASLTNLPIPNSPTVALDINWAQSFMITNRMYIFLIVYAVVSGLWIVGSLLVIATICGPVTKWISAFCFWPWFIFVMAGSMLDAVATGYHINDIIHTTTAADTFKYAGITVPDNNVMSFLETFDAYFITPAVVLTCVSSRVVLIWLLNIFGTSFCLSLSRVLAVQEKHKHHHKHHKHVAQQQYQQNQGSSQANEIGYQFQSPYSNESQGQNSGYPSYQQNRPAPLIINTANATTTTSPTQPKSPQQMQMQREASSTLTPTQSPYVPNAPALTPDVVVVESVRPQSSSNVVIADDITYRKTDSHPDRLDYPPKTPQSPTGAMTTTAQLATGSVLNNRYSTFDGGYQNSNQNQSPQRVSDELRSQLPWSYTSMITKPPPPRKPQSQMYPEIPEPDYNEESSKGGQQQISSETGQQHAYSRW